MQEKILQFIQQIEQERGIKVLLACETGSRAWGFPSPDSDFDVRLVYIHPRDWYLSLGERKDTIEAMLENNDLDISGWDFRKSLRLLWKSNAPLLERIQSPIIYKADQAFLHEMQEVAAQCYSRIATMYHYLSMAKNCLADVKEAESYKLKKLFYALRTATACKWILEREEMPPIEFPKMMDGLDLAPSLKARIQELIALKSTCSESYFHQGEPEIFTFIENCIEQAGQRANSLPAAKGKQGTLDTFFLKTLAAQWT